MLVIIGLTATTLSGAGAEEKEKPDWRLMFIVPVSSIKDGRYEKAIRGLETKTIHTDLASEKLLDQCVPCFKRNVGRFTEYEFVYISGYHGLMILAKDGLLKRATESSCTFVRTYFDDMTPADVKEYQDILSKNRDIPAERFIGRWGWERQPKRVSELEQK
jgi:hypothetical protein